MPRGHQLPLAWLAAVGCLAWGSAAIAQQVNLVGLSSGRALLVIDGGTPRFAAAGQALGPVKVLEVGANQAVVDVQGERRVLQLGAGPIAPAVTDTSQRIILLADGGGHFTADGQINGQPARFLVDTGATVMTLSESQAARLGLNYRNGQRVRVKTANGEITGHQLLINTVRVGGHTSYGLAAVVLPADLPYVLLGNSYLSRFRMQREDGRMTLEPRQ